jgi:hypothetical protein
VSERTRARAPSERTKARVALIIAVVVVFVVPLVLDRDSFPLSTYPMFSSRRTSTEVVDTAVARTADDSTTWRLDPERIAATDEVIIAAVTVSEAVRDGSADELCREIAGRVQDNGPDGAAVVEVVTERFDAVTWFEGDRTPIERIVHARCDVPGGET